MIAGSVVPSALIRTWYETCSLMLDIVHCGGNFGLPRGRQGGILTCPEVPDSQKGGSREYPYWLANAVHIHVTRVEWFDPRSAGLVPIAVRRQHNDVAGFIYAVLGVVYAVLLGLMVVAVWEEWNT